MQQKIYINHLQIKHIKLNNVNLKQNKRLKKQLCKLQKEGVKKTSNETKCNIEQSKQATTKVTITLVS